MKSIRSLRVPALGILIPILILTLALYYSGYHSYDRGYNLGFEDGYDDGYYYGYNDCLDEIESSTKSRYENLDGITCDVEWDFIYSDARIEVYNKYKFTSPLLPNAVKCFIHVENKQPIARSVDISLVGYDKSGNPAYLDYTFSGVILPGNSAEVQHEIPINKLGEVNSRIVYTDLVEITAFPEFSILEDDELSELNLYNP